MAHQFTGDTRHDLSPRMLPQLQKPRRGFNEGRNTANQVRKERDCT